VEAQGKIEKEVRKRSSHGDTAEAA